MCTNMKSYVRESRLKLHIERGLCRGSSKGKRAFSTSMPNSTTDVITSGVEVEGRWRNDGSVVVKQ